jgi:cytochrome c oxidase subunit 1
MRGERALADDPWGHANSLEWVTSCPPPRHNFITVPRIRSERPAFDLHHPAAAAAAQPNPGVTSEPSGEVTR